MPLKRETKDICGYYDESWIQPKRDGGRMFAEILAEAIEEWATPYERWPVRNREPRTPISSQKRAIIHLRDGDACRTCGVDDQMLTIDHIVPRSAFPADQLHIADRSDNLISACWPCNEAKSNYERTQRKRLGVVVACWYCLSASSGEDLPTDRPVNQIVFCGRCYGVSYVPEVQGWVL